MAGFGLNDRRALLIGLPLRERIIAKGIDIVIKDFLRPTRIAHIDCVFVVDKTRDYIEDFALLTAVENLRQRGLRHTTHFDPCGHVTQFLNEKHRDFRIARALVHKNRHRMPIPASIIGKHFFGREIFLELVLVQPGFGGLF